MTTHYTVSTTCPQCGHTTSATHDTRSMSAAFGNDPNISVICPQCRTSYEESMALACAEWDDYCQEIPLPADV